MKKNKSFLFLIFLATSNLFLAQLGIGTTSVKPSAGLEVSSSTNKGLLLPRVDISDITDSTKPINNPATGLIVFNIGSMLTSGIYIWYDAQWNLVSDSAGLVGFMLLQKKGDVSILGGLDNGTYQNFTSGFNMNVLKNDIGANYTSEGAITLPANSGYVLNLCINIRNTKETKTSGIKNFPIQVHLYQIKLIDPSTNTQYGDTISINATSSTLDNSTNTFVGNHLINASFAFSTKSEIKLIPAITHYDGGTYQKSSTGTPDGSVIVENIKIDIQRGILVQ